MNRTIDKKDNLTSINISIMNNTTDKKDNLTSINISIMNNTIDKKDNLTSVSDISSTIDAANEKIENKQDTVNSTISPYLNNPHMVSLINTSKLLNQTISDSMMRSLNVKIDMLMPYIHSINALSQLDDTNFNKENLQILEDKMADNFIEQATKKQFYLLQNIFSDEEILMVLSLIKSEKNRNMIRNKLADQYHDVVTSSRNGVMVGILLMILTRMLLPLVPELFYLNSILNRTGNFLVIQSILNGLFKNKTNIQEIIISAIINVLWSKMIAAIIYCITDAINISIKTILEMLYRHYIRPQLNTMHNATEYMPKPLTVFFQRFFPRNNVSIPSNQSRNLLAIGDTLGDGSTTSTNSRSIGPTYQLADDCFRELIQVTGFRELIQVTDSESSGSSGSSGSTTTNTNSRSIGPSEDREVRVQALKRIDREFQAIQNEFGCVSKEAMDSLIKKFKESYLLPTLDKCLGRFPPRE